MRILIGAIFLVGLLENGVNSATTSAEDAEISANTVILKFYLMSEDDWTNKETIFKTSVADASTQYCKNNIGLCGLTEWANTYAFSDSDVTSPSQTIENKNTVMAVEFYVKFSSNVPQSSRNTTSYVLNKAAVSSAVAAIRETLNVDMGHAVVGIDQDKYSPPPNKKLNAILIPIAFVVLLVIPIIVMVACLCWRKRQDKKEAKEERRKTLDGKKKDEKERRAANEVQNKHQGGNSPSHSAKVGPAPSKKGHKGKHNGSDKGQSDDYAQWDPNNADSRPNASSLPPLDPAEDKKRKKKEKKDKKKRDKQRIIGAEDGEAAGNSYHVVNEQMNIPADANGKKSVNQSESDNEDFGINSAGEQDLTNTQTTEL